MFPPHVYEIESTASRVILRSSIRAPFEPKGSLVTMKADLRRAIAQLQRPQPFLYARYSSAVRQLADAENVLFYNVGTASFAGLATERVILERDFKTDSNFAHEHLYTTVTSEPTAWSLRPPVCEWILPYVTDSDSSRLVGRLWLATRRSQPRMYDDRSLAQPLYGIELRITGVPRVNLLGKMKPLLDGVISGMHTYNGDSEIEVCARLARMLGESEEELGALLQGSGPLGPRNLVRPYRERVQWNPADDACVYADMRLEPGPDPHILVSLHPVQPIART